MSQNPSFSSPNPEHNLADVSNRPELEVPTTQLPGGEETGTEYASDEALGRELDAYLESLLSGKAEPAGPPVAGGEAEQLKATVRKLHQLSDTLSFVVAEDTGDEAGVEKPQPPLRQRIGKYEVRKVLGSGGQAQAFLAFDPDLRRHVVIKLYHAARDPAEQEAVLNEGRALARVRSPHVAQCYGADRHEGVPYLVVEYVSGKTLAELHRTQKLTTERAVEITGHMAEGLAAIHACGLLHRDIKPSNIIVGDDGMPRLVDFGLATHLGSEALERISGTLPYMAPEQARGEVERIDPRSDLFGLGAVLYELLTGRPPHQAPSREKLLQAAQVGDVVAPRDREPATPQAASDLCMRCLAKDPSQRFASARELSDAIRRWQRRRRWKGLNLEFGLGSRKVRIFIGTAAAMLLLFPFAVWTLQSMSRPSGVFERVRQQTDMPEGVPALAPDAAFPPSILTFQHPDGRPLRRDFQLQLELIGSRPGRGGQVILTEGDKISIRIAAERDCFVGVWSVELDTVVQLFPNDAESDHRLRAGQPRVIPGEPDVPDQERKLIRVTPSKGGEYLHAVASTHPLSSAEGERFGPYVIVTKPAERSRWQEQLRGLVLETAPPRDEKAPAVSEVIIQYQVEPRSDPERENKP